jgi:tetratricopeptide (TPR) repeat protein
VKLQASGFPGPHVPYNGFMETQTKSAEQLLATASQCLAVADYRGAHAACMETLQAFGPTAEAFFLLGVLTADHDNHAKAVELFDRALTLNSDVSSYHAHKAKSLLAQHKRDMALEAANRAAALIPRDALTYDTIGVVYTRLGDHAAAIDLFERAVSANPDIANFHYNLGASRQFAGDFDGAALAYEMAIKLEPEMDKAYSSVVGLKKQTEDSNLIPQMTAMFEASCQDADRAHHLGHALAKSFEDLGDYSTSLDWLKRAKRQKGQSIGYTIKADAAVFEAARDTVLSDRGGWSSERPIFIIGLPRTGTTLVDRILASHSQVRSAGELSNFALIAKQMTSTSGNMVMDAKTLAAARSVDFEKLGRSYEVSTDNLVGDAPRFLDKMPLNFAYAGLIHSALPNARIICLRRHPMDACLSNYRQLFATSFSYYNYAFDLEDCGRYYLEFDQLTAHWRKTIPADRYLEIAYEDIVSDLEGSVHQLLDHCGLAWEEGCLDFHTQGDAVATASSVQVRQPIYSSSVDRWRRYGTALDDLQAVLRVGGVLGPNGEWQRG